MHMHPLLPALVASILVVLLVGAIVRRFGQPHVIAYLLVGVVLGPAGMSLFDGEAVALVGEFGVILLLFFVGMEVNLSRLVTGWRVSVVGTLLQIVFSIAAVAAIGLWFDWPWSRIVLVGFAISLSSTALVVTMLRQWKEMETEAGQDALGVLLVQDVALAPMLIIVGLLGGSTPSRSLLAMQLAGGIGIVLLVMTLVRKKTIRLPFGDLLRRDHELQLFGAFLLCFFFAWLTGVAGLSTALGAFVAGLVVASARETEWIHRNLEPFRVLFVAAFFVSVGMLVDLRFFSEHWQPILALVLAAFLTNTLINAGTLHALGRGWGTSVYVGALLSQIGEFSFILAAVGKDIGIMTDFGYQLVLSVIVGSLVLGPGWIAVLRPLRGPSARAKTE
ncbi:MAG: CPA2 family monovalent cation:H+ antiporter-2 [Planctomycetota bacterium]|jgi:CPA2 family monovalent cation:H+ antiporter-2